MLHCVHYPEPKGGRDFLNGVSSPKPCWLFAFSTLINSVIMQLVISSLQMIAAICLSALCNSTDVHFYATYVQHRSPKTLPSSCYFELSLSPEDLQLFPLPPTLLKTSDVNSMDVHFIHTENSSQQGQLNLLCFISACTFSCCMWSLHRNAFS